MPLDAFNAVQDEVGDVTGRSDAVNPISAVYDGSSKKIVVNIAVNSPSES